MFCKVVTVKQNWQFFKELCRFGRRRLLNSMQNPIATKCSRCLTTPPKCPIFSKVSRKVSP